MGCNVCGNVEQEAQISFPPSDGLKSSVLDFQSLFNNNLQNFGEYCSNNDFESIIPNNIQNYMSKHPLNNKQKNNKESSVYEIKPIKFKNGNLYKGKWNKDLKMEGPGLYYLKEDKIFAEGNWDNGECKFARVFLPNGDIYEGEIKDSKYNGKGKLISANGEIYEGDFINGEKTGYGKITFPDETIYEGNLNKGEFEGNGKMTWNNGYEYTGEFKGFSLNGKGKLLEKNGDVYEGDFENNLFHGQGKYIFYKTGDEYNGEFQYGIRKGKGIYKSKDKYIFDGNWDNDLPCGIGRLFNWEKTAILKSTWRYGKIVEDPIYELGNETDFESIEYDIRPNEINLNTNELSHLESSFNNDCTQYNLGNFPSFLNE